VKRWGGAVHPVTLNAGAMVLASGVVGALAAVVERGRPVKIDGAAVGSVLYLAIVGTAVAFSLYFWLLRHMAATSLSLTAYFIPLVALVVGAVAFDERLTMRVATGAALVVAGTVLATRHRQARR
jgi:drug/metabolite transporter (DMT)-like permease